MSAADMADQVIKIVMMVFLFLSIVTKVTRGRKTLRSACNVTTSFVGVGELLDALIFAVILLAVSISWSW